MKSIAVAIIMGILIYILVWVIPDKNKQIQDLTEKVVNLEIINSRLVTAMKFENLFVLMATPKQLVEMKNLDSYIKDKKEFCLEDHNDLNRQ